MKHLITLMGMAGMVSLGVARPTPTPAQITDPAQLARPSEAQMAFHELERFLFIHFHPGTWYGSEYDNGQTDLSIINPEKLDTDQWCEVAQSWGAKQILYVAKHCGGFCWWRTDTTEYSIKNTPYRDGKGDVMRELVDSCKKYGLKFGVYVYPGDPAWGAEIGSGGLTADPTRQAAYSKVLRQQLTEVWTQYGDVTEAWFDGSCKVPIEDLRLFYDGHEVLHEMLSTVQEDELYHINRTAAVVDDSKITLTFTIRSARPEDTNLACSIKRAF